MAYVGQGIKGGTFSVLDTSSNTYNGSNVTFNLGTQVSSPAQLLVSHDGVIQKPVTDYTIATGGTQITFTTAPASGASIFITEISGAVGAPMNRDINGDELILDADADTSITADTDDQIDVRIAGTDVVNLTNSSSDLVVTHAVQDKDIVFKGDDGGSAITALTLDMSAGGDLTLGANANIVFPGTNVVSTNANTLDDYEEGAWTPACPNVTVAASEGKYTKVGRLVTVQGYATWPTTSDSNDIEISGLPFTINNSESGRGGAYVTYPTAGASFLVNGDGFYLLGAKNDTKFFAAAADGNTTQVNSEVSAKQFYFNGQFYTDS
jgi:hypothetical protein